MDLYPAIDLKNGECVRLRQGDMDQATVFNNKPGQQAAQFIHEGAQWIHVVDLNGAFQGKTVNGSAVDAIIDAARGEAKVQLGGGIRDMKAIETWLERGVNRVIMGTAAVQNPDLVKEACKTFQGHVAVGIDARGGKVAVSGWAETSEMDVIELAKIFENEGVAAIIYTDIDRDGMMQGPNVSATAELARATSTPIIASGGVSGLADVVELHQTGAGIAGCIIGRALYDKTIDLTGALKTLSDINAGR